MARDPGLEEATPDSAAPPASALTAPERPPFRLSGRWRSVWLILASFGPGLIAANAGNDAGGIATYASVGARYGYSLLWMLPLMAISLCVVQEMAARMGAATGKGLSDLIRENFPLHATALVMLALLVSNGGTVVSEFVGVRAALGLILPLWAQYIALPLVALGIWLIVVRGNYTTAEKVFLAMTLVFFAYPISAIMAHPNWSKAAHDTVVPTIHFSQGYFLIFIALIGTTITPYMQVYVQSAVAEKGVTPRDYGPARIEIYVGSVFAILIAGFIILATAATLYPHHPVETAADAARALGPVAGKYAELLFATGLFGASLLAAAILPLATAYSVSEALGVEKGVSQSFREAPIFMGLFSGLIVLGVVVALIPGLPLIQVLVFVQVINGLLLPVVLFSILRLVNNRKLMGSMRNGPLYNVIAYATAIIISLISLVLLVTTVLGVFGVNL